MPHQLVPIILVVAVAMAIVLFAVIASRQHAASLAHRTREVFKELGLHYEAKGDAEFISAWSVIPGLPKRGQTHHIAFGDYHGLPVTAFRHRYVVSTGQSSSVVVHWVYSTDTPQWPAMHLRKRTGFGRLLGQKSPITGDHAFDRMWVVKTESSKFAAEILSPAVRELLMAPAPQLAKWSSMRWHFVGGKVCLVVRGSIKPARTREALDHLVAMWQALNPA